MYIIGYERLFLLFVWSNSALFPTVNGQKFNDEGSTRRSVYLHYTGALLNPTGANLSHLEAVPQCTIILSHQFEDVKYDVQITGIEMWNGFHVNVPNTTRNSLVLVIPVVSITGKIRMNSQKNSTFFLATALNFTASVRGKLENSIWSREDGRALNLTVQNAHIVTGEVKEKRAAFASKILRDHPEILFTEEEQCVGEKMVTYIFNLVNNVDDGKRVFSKSRVILSNSIKRSKRQVEECSGGVDNFLDEVLNGAQEEIKKNDPLALGKADEFVQFRDGTLEGLSTVHRAGRTSSDCTESRINIAAPLAANNVNVRYRWSKKVLSFNLDGSIHAQASRLEVLFRVTLETSSGFDFQLNEAKVTELKDFKVRMTGLGPLNYLFIGIVKLVNAVCKNTVKKALSGIMQRALQKEVGKLSFTYE